MLSENLFSDIKNFRFNFHLVLLISLSFYIRKPTLVLYGISLWKMHSLESIGYSKTCNSCGWCLITNTRLYCVSSMEDGWGIGEMLLEFGPMVRVHFISMISFHFSTVFFGMISPSESYEFAVSFFLDTNLWWHELNTGKLC